MKTSYNFQEKDTTTTWYSIESLKILWFKVDVLEEMEQEANLFGVEYFKTSFVHKNIDSIDHIF